MGREGSAQNPKAPCVSTGIPGLDKLLGGGIPRGYLLLVAGGPGVGKTILSVKYIYEG
ncbi:TPA: hypothetical protein EYP44_02310, partial [Candidatus Bathyarchaeota archaeon]|nr:hypothetical protein [Candidatus Bathyarchaeota archaeon]